MKFDFAISWKECKLKFDRQFRPVSLSLTKGCSWSPYTETLKERHIAEIALYSRNSGVIGLIGKTHFAYWLRVKSRDFSIGEQTIMRWIVGSLSIIF